MLTIDFETRSEASLKDCGAAVYAAHPTTKVLCMAYKFDEGFVSIWKPFENEPFPQEVQDHIDRGGMMEAHNSFFEQAIFKYCLKKKVPLEQWSCSMAKCAVMALPQALDKVTQALDTPVKKDREGKKIMMRMTRKRKPTKAHPDPEGYWVEDEENFEKLYAYCKDDVASEHCVSTSLRDLSPAERKIWKLDQTINWRGLPVNVECCKRIIELIGEYKPVLTEKLVKLTRGELKSGSQSVAMVKYLRGLGLDIADVKSETVKEALESLPEGCEAYEILKLRQDLSKSSTAKYEKFVGVAAVDGRARGCLAHHGASTGRWAGRLIQPQNFPRGNFKFEELEQIMPIALKGGLPFLDMLGVDPMKFFSSSLRYMVCAEAGTIFVNADYSSIEARVLMWAADHSGGLDIFRSGGDIYIDMAADIYNVKMENVTEQERFMGKQAILGLGYQMGPAAFKRNCKLKGNIEVSLDFCERVVDAYREKYSNIKDLWYSTEVAAVRAVKYGKPVNCGKFKYFIYKDFLCCRLPSGRSIFYYKPLLETKMMPWGKMKVCLTHMTTDKGKYVRKSTYGGKLVENNCQATARDIMTNGMLNCEAKGYRTILTVHDEVMAEVDEGSDWSVSEFEKLMCDLPSWAKDIPVTASGWSGKNYRK